MLNNPQKLAAQRTNSLVPSDFSTSANEYAHIKYRVEFNAPEESFSNSTKSETKVNRLQNDRTGNGETRIMNREEWLKKMGIDKIGTAYRDKNPSSDKPD